MISYVLILLIIISTIFLFYPINIYLLLPYSEIFTYNIDDYNIVNKNINFFVDTNIIYKRAGNGLFDIRNNTITITSTNNDKYVFDIDKDMDKYIPMIINSL